MAKKQWGARAADWKRFVELGLAPDMLPLVCNPGAPIAPESTMNKVGKTPSRYNGEGFVVGLGKWTERTTERAQVRRWMKQSDYGICIQTRKLRAVDIDVPNPQASDKIAEVVRKFFKERELPVPPMRYRSNSGKCLFAFYVEGEIPKQTLAVDGGIIEFLGNGQQFVAAGTHDSGVPYKWNWHDNEDFPSISAKRYEKLISILEAKFGVGELVKDGKRNKRDKNAPAITDETIEKLDARGLILGYGSEGQGFIECPFASEHTTESAISATAYFPPSRGYQQGHFVCLHAHCQSRENNEFLDALGFLDEEFEDHSGGASNDDLIGKRRDSRASNDDDLIGTKKKKKTKNALMLRPDTVRRDAGDVEGTGDALPNLALPGFERDPMGRILANVANLTLALMRPDICQYKLAFDDFLHDYMIVPHNAKRPEAWRPLTDDDYTSIQIILEDGGFLPIQFDALKRTIKRAANVNHFDSAQMWIETLPEWDGVKRIDTFMPEYFGTVDNDYTRAMGRYIWSALAGRAVKPGVEAHMVPVFVGDQGSFKSTAIRAMSPTPDTFVPISLSTKEDDLSRLMRGKLVVEIEELRGLNGRDAEYIKAFISRTRETWIKKFEERASSFYRRCIFFGSTNIKQFLADQTGERRWLPVYTGKIKPINYKRIRKNRLQLWAEGLAVFQESGVDWSVEQLARGEHAKFKIVSPWLDIVEKWLVEPDPDTKKRPCDDEYISPVDVLSGAIGMSLDRITRANEMEIGKILSSLGYMHVRPMIDGRRVWRYSKKSR